MLIYQDTTAQFIKDIRENIITDIMSRNFIQRLGRKPVRSESASWQNSLPRVRDLIEIAELYDNKIALEYEVPYIQNRIDCLLFGKGENDSDNIVLLELKQWTSVQALEIDGNFVETYTGGRDRVVAHPSQQVQGYSNYLKGFIEGFDAKPPLVLFSCSYCHNYKKNAADGLFNPIYQKLIEEYPVYTKNDTMLLANKIKELLKEGKGFEIFNRFMQSPVRPTKKLLENVARVIRNEVVFSLLNEQLVAKNLIWSKVARADKTQHKSVIIVHGGPGTGKSVIAINILAEAAQRRKKVFYGCKSKPFTEGLKSLVGRDGALLFSNLYRFIPSRVQENELDLLLIDEAHRIEKNSNHQHTRRTDRTDMPQIDQLIRCAKTSVFFIDDKQNVRWKEIGNSQLIKDTAIQYKCEFEEVTLETQYRCMGSNDYLLWIESVLGYASEKRILRKDELFDFKIFDNPQALYNALAIKEAEKHNSARLVAGFCWPWSQNLAVDGSLVNDVKIGDFAMPWETHDKITRPPRGFVKWFEWAYKPEGFKQVGCIYTAQGFEFDYIGVIVGDDLSCDIKNNCLVGNIAATKDPVLRQHGEDFDRYVKNIYRTLLTRGMKGCFVYFTNGNTRKFFEQYLESKAEVIELIPYVNSLPLVELRAAADSGYATTDGVFTDDSSIKLISVEGGPFQKDRFVVRADGDSMEPHIPDGSLCLFRKDLGGSRNGKIVLCRIEGFAGEFPFAVIKRYQSARSPSDESLGMAQKIVLSSLNTNHEPIVLSDGDEFSILGIFERVISEEKA